MTTAGNIVQTGLVHRVPVGLGFRCGLQPDKHAHRSVHPPVLHTIVPMSAKHS